MSEESDKKLILDNISLIVNNVTKDSVYAGGPPIDGSFIDTVRNFYNQDDDYYPKPEDVEKVIADIQTSAGYDVVELFETYDNLEEAIGHLDCYDHFFMKDKSYLDKLDKDCEIKEYELGFVSDLLYDTWCLFVLVVNDEIIGWAFDED